MVDIASIICNWSTYKGSHCRRNIHQNDVKDKDKTPSRYCILHKDLIVDYKKITEEELCETFEEIKIVPRSYKHIKSVMASMDNEDDIVEVFMTGGSIEEADISNNGYIILVSDNCKYYYESKKGSKNAKDLKIILKRYCKNNCVVSVSDIKYCEECYKKLKNVPKISVIN